MFQMFSPQTHLPVQVCCSLEAALQLTCQSSAGLHTDWLVCREREAEGKFTLPTTTHIRVFPIQLMKRPAGKQVTQR